MNLYLNTLKIIGCFIFFWSWQVNYGCPDFVGGAISHFNGNEELFFLSFRHHLVVNALFEIGNTLLKGNGGNATAHIN